MIEHELTALADRVAPPAAPDLPDRVLERIASGSPDDPRAGGRRRRAVVAAAVAALAASSLLSPQIRAFAADLLSVAGIEISSDTPEAPPEPRAPLPELRRSSVTDAQAAAGFRVRLPAALGPPEEVTVADGGRIVTLRWRDGEIVLDQFDGSLGPVFAKRIGVTATETVRLGDTHGWWIGSAHEVTYVDREGREVTATTRLAGPSLVWEDSGVTLRLEGTTLDVDQAAAIARSVH